jgi:hypothetical protein
MRSKGAMTSSYRDESEALREKNRALEEKLAERDREIAELKRHAADHDAVFHRLEHVLESKARDVPAVTPRKVIALVIAAAVGAALGMMHLLTPKPSRAAPPSTEHPDEAVPLPTTAEGWAPPLPQIPTDLCATPGVKLTVDGSDAFAPATLERDLAGHKYRPGGERSPWFTVNQSGITGPIYVHGVGDYVPGDLGLTSFSLFTIMTKGETGGYTLARGGKSLLEVTHSDGKFIAGRFEADASQVADTTREPPFGTPVVRVRGSFCLRALPANPSDTGP